MITLKFWNSLTEQSRKEIANIVKVYATDIEKPYHHNFDFDTLGGKVKQVLEACYLQKDGTLKINVTYTPKVAPKEEPKSNVSAKQMKAEKFISAINAGFSSAVAVLPEIIKTYGNKNGDIYADVEMGWNNKVDGFCLGKKGVSVSIYWQGDSTDGNDYISISQFGSRSEVVIPADVEFLGDRTYTRHGDLRVYRDDVYKAIKSLIPQIK